MTEDQIQNNTESKVVTTNNSAVKSFSSAPKREFKKNKRSNRKGREGAPRSEFDQKILEIRRVTRVAAGGRRFNFSVAIVIGDKKGKVGVGIGKAGDTSMAIEKAVKNAKKDVLKLKLNSDGSIIHATEAKYSSAYVVLRPVSGRGIIAGSALKDVVELVGLKNINGKIVSGSKNKLNIARATIKALSNLQLLSKRNVSHKNIIIADKK